LRCSQWWGFVMWSELGHHIIWYIHGYECFGGAFRACLHRPSDIWQFKDKEDCVIKTNLMHCLSWISFVNQPLHVSGIFVAYHQEVYCIYIQQLVHVGLFSWLSIGRPTDSQLKRFLLHRYIKVHSQQNIKNKEDCSSSEVTYVIIIIWMTVATI